jgi:hypothetical protein
MDVVRAFRRFAAVPLVVAAALLAGAPRAAVADAPWHQWRGPNRDGFVAGAAWPDGLEQSRVERAWRVDLGPSYSGPVVAGDLVIVTETKDAKTEHVRAFDRKSQEFRDFVITRIRSPRVLKGEKPEAHEASDCRTGEQPNRTRFRNLTPIRYRIDVEREGTIA